MSALANDATLADEIPANGPGYVYVLSNPSMPGILKIGLTARPVESRMIDLHSTGVPTAFRKEFALHVADARQVEQAVHRSLSEHRVSSNREFFRASPDEAKATILRAALGSVTNAECFEDYARYHADGYAALRAQIAAMNAKRLFWRKLALAFSIPLALLIATVVAAILRSSAG